MNQEEFSLDLENVAWFYACHGSRIEIMPYKDVTQSVLELYLNGSVYGAILHQRKTLPLHGSCFKYQGLGIMICGESGVGKSSLTTSFCLKGASFLTDDVSPILLKNGKPHIWGVSDRIKLWSDSLVQLEQNEEGLERIFPEQGKYYFPMESAQGKVFPLTYIFILHTHKQREIVYQPVEGVEKFTALRNEIYRLEYLQGMKESETAYLKQLIMVCRGVTVVNVYRPTDISIEQLQFKFNKLILAVASNQNLNALEIADQ
ncbi:hypothetical protein G8759_15525 [Spirosoma aureum]|uniref:HPr kinase/phosphorylase C-terminal domain-containing protein n=1 Tax=Spirosoma aureum TaxID=2692134 RepID=A0A6G9ANE2_9BACT|nr:hypothetical protein [Spirosoma aureum]QIP13920.1 hypothetical protein G8759_15525 [Spirosoma aureum]